MSASDHASTPDAFPTPPTGSGTVDLATDSNDPQELRTLLERARERLSFYESFDRIIGENLRRTGEMMAETVTLREQAAAAAQQAAADRAAAEAATRAERERYRGVIEEALSEVRAAQPLIDGMVQRLQSALDELSGDVAPTDPPAVPTVVDANEPAEERGDAVSTADMPAEAITPEPPADEPDAESKSNVDAGVAAEEMPESEEDMPERPTAPTGPTSIDVIAHRVPSAAAAIGLQQMLRELDVITKVEAREFADGELRLHIECEGPVPDDPLADWLSRNSGSLVSRNDKAIELSFS